MLALKLELPAREGCFGKAFQEAVKLPFCEYLRGWILPVLEWDMEEMPPQPTDPLKLWTQPPALPLAS